MTSPKPPKPIRCYALVNAKGRTMLVTTSYRFCTIARPVDERIIRGRFVPDAKKGRKRG